MKQIIIEKPGTYEYTLAKEGEEIEILGAFKLVHHDTFKLHITLIHQAAHTKGNIFLRATVDDEAKVDLSGNIIVKKTAVDANSFLTENILLLSELATAEAVPNLEILNNDVHCSHAATVGQIDDDQLFYLQSRGISLDKAKTMIAQGFLSSVTDKIKKEL